MRWWLTGFVVLALHAQQPAPAPDLLGKIQAKVSENLNHLPNYTCAETIERSSRTTHASKFQRADTIHLEVAYVAGNELFGWPGATKIDEPDITRLIGKGAIGNGDFALIPQGIFQAQGAAAFQPVGDAPLEGKPAIRYDYRVRPPNGGYRLRIGSREAVVGYHGSFWADPVTLDLMRIEMAAEEIPTQLGITSVTNWLEYSRVAISKSTFLLPRGSELIMIDAHEGEKRNRTSFQACRQFSGESVLKFDEPTSEPAPVAVLPPIGAPDLPEDFTVELRLETPIDSASAGVGDAFRATLAQSIKLNRQTVVPKGAAVAGHISLLERRAGIYLLDLEVSSLDFERGHADLSTRQNKMAMLEFRSGRLVNPSPIFGSGTMSVRGDRLQLPRGATLTLRSRLVKSTHNDSIPPRD